MRIFCLINDFHFCCQQTNSSSLLGDTGERICCTYDQYNDQYWVTLAAIKGYLILLTLMMIYLISFIGYVYFTSRNISETDVKGARRQIVKHLMKRQILHKSRGRDISMLSSLRSLANTLSSVGSRPTTINITPSKPKPTKSPAVKSIAFNHRQQA